MVIELGQASSQVTGLKPPSNTPLTGSSSLLTSYIPCPMTVNQVLVNSSGQKKKIDSSCFYMTSYSCTTLLGRSLNLVLNKLTLTVSKMLRFDLRRRGPFPLHGCPGKVQGDFMAALWLPGVLEDELPRFQRGIEEGTVEVTIGCLQGGGRKWVPG